MALLHIRQLMRALFIIFILVSIYWVFTHKPEGAFTIALFQTFPLLLVAPVFIRCSPPYLHIAMPIIMIYLCFIAPNLFLPWPLRIVPIIEFAVNIALSSTIMWYLLKSSQEVRRQRTQAP